MDDNKDEPTAVKPKKPRKSYQRKQQQQERARIAREGRARKRASDGLLENLGTEDQQQASVPEPAEPSTSQHGHSTDDEYLPSDEATHSEEAQKQKGTLQFEYIHDRYSLKLFCVSI